MFCFKPSASFNLPSCAALLLASNVVLAAPPQYSVTALGLLPGGQYLDAYAVNNNGIVTGYGYDGNTNVGVIWQQGQLSTLGILPEGATSGGYDINSAGVITGSSGGYAFLWQNGQMTALPRLAGGSYASANAINDSNQVAGSADSKAVMWTNGQISVLPRLSGEASSVAIGLNTQGVAVGTSTNQSYVTTAVVWQDGQVKALSSGTARGAGATDINNTGAVVGFVDKGGNQDQAARWDNGQLTLLNNVDGSLDARAYGINDAGLAVGSAFIGPSSLATVWEGAQAFVLNNLLVNGQGWDLRQALDINASGQIIGWGSLNGQAQSFLLTPVPEATTAAYMSLGMLALLGLRRLKTAK
jgi:uncharacterized membrane protein